jgi:6-phosphogluconolactonase
MTDFEEVIDFRDRGLVLVLPTSAALANRAADTFASAAQEAQWGRGGAYIALSGGSTPLALGRRLASPPFDRRIPWDHIQFFWGDERWAPPESDESNAGTAMRTFLAHVPIPKDHIHPYEVSAADPKTAAAEMEAKIRALLPENEYPPRFDLILLGLGDDGHTASLFPGTSAIYEDRDLVLAHHVPKLNADRLTFTPPLINAARQIVFLVSGSGKASALKQVLEGEYQPDLFPAQVVRPFNGKVTWLVDADAAAELSRNPSPQYG